MCSAPALLFILFFVRFCLYKIIASIAHLYEWRVSVIFCRLRDDWVVERGYEQYYSFDFSRKLHYCMARVDMSKLVHMNITQSNNSISHDKSVALSKIRAGDIAVVLVLALISCGFLIAAVTERNKGTKAVLQVLHVPTSEVVGSSPVYRGAANAPNTLIEFGDYQCPPCRAANRTLNSMIANYHDKVKVTFRNLPLTQIHPLAMQAAVLAEEARFSGKFWQAHDQLYSGDVVNLQFTCKRLSQIYEQANEAKKARTIVLNDILEAQKLGIRGTPSFILCKADGHIVRLDSIQSLAGQLK